MKLFHLILSLFVFILMPLQTVIGQSLQVGDPFELYLRTLNPNDAPSYQIRPVNNSLPDDTHPWSERSYFAGLTSPMFNLYTPAWRTSWNSSFPFGQNDGAIWQGRGLNSSLSFGIQAEYKFLEVSFRPITGITQNRNFDLHPLQPPANRFEWASYRRGIDLPQRFGNSSYSWFDPGQSYIKAGFFGISAGLSTQNFWVGPAIHNPLMISNNAPGFLHAFFQTDRPFQTRAGSFEWKIFWGTPHSSDYYELDPYERDRFFTGATVTYSPAFFPGFHIGAFRGVMEYIPEDGIGSNQVLAPFRGHTTSNFARTAEQRDGRNQMISLFGRYQLPKDGFEIYFEWGRNDNYRDSRDLSISPEHSRAWLIGWMKPFRLAGNRLLTVNMEMTQLEPSRIVEFRTTTPPFYQHFTVREGWTNRGQILGAGTMMGSNNQIITVHYYDNWGMAGISMNRIEQLNFPHTRHNEQILSIQDDDFEGTVEDLRQLEFRPGLHGVLFLPYNLELEGAVNVSFIRNRYNLFGNHERNLNLQFTVRYGLDRFMR